MAQNTTIAVTDCRDCPYRYDNRGHGECWAECDHPEAPGNYKNILWGCQSQFKSVPAWCPLSLGGGGADEKEKDAFQHWVDASVDMDRFIFDNLVPAKDKTGDEPMIDLDQSNYNDMISEAQTLADHIQEWSEQFGKVDAESELAWAALSRVKSAIFSLRGAKNANAVNQSSERNALLKRIETGTTTARDAIVAKRWMS